MFLFDSEKAQAVLFFGKESISKELLYPELEALLDGFVPLEEWAGSNQKAAYVEFNHEFVVVAAVFFTMKFDAKGAVDSAWNLPLVDMARTTTRGPDMGAGPIHIACASQCPIAYFKDWLWDPDLTPQSNHLKQIKRALKRNRLGVHFRNNQAGGEEKLPADLQRLELQFSQQFNKQYEQVMREQMAQLLEGQRSRIASMTSDKDQAMDAMRAEHARAIAALETQLAAREAQLQDAQARTRELSATIDGQIQKIEGLREYYEHKLRRSQGSEAESLEAVKVRLEAQLNAKVTAATAQLQELLKMKEVELLYRSEHEEQLRQDIARLRREQQEFQANSGNQFLEKLSRKGVNFVTYQPGAGHITIPYSEMEHFLDNPSAFTASYCGVSEKLYLAWLKHYQTPVCAALDEQGEICAADLPRVVNPAEFVPGESDCCEKHGRQKSGKLKAS